MADPLKIRIRGIRQSVPDGYVLGRVSNGTGDVELLDLVSLAQQLSSTGVLSTPGSVTGLSPIASPRVLANVSGASAIPTATTVTALFDAALGSTQGQITYRNATVWTVLNPVLKGSVLIDGGAAGNPSWSFKLRVDDVTGQILSNYNVSQDIESSPAAYTGGSYGAPVYAAGGYFIGARANGTSASPTTVLSGQKLAAFYGNGYDGTDFIDGDIVGGAEGSPGLVAETTETWDATGHGAKLVLSVIANNTVTPLFAVVIDHDGGVLLPFDVAGGSKGVGTINVSGGYYVDGVLQTAGSAPNGMLPLVTGETPGPVAIADASGQFIGVPL